MCSVVTLEVMKQRKSASFSKAGHMYIHDFQLVALPSLSNALLFMSHTRETGPTRVLETSPDHIASNQQLRLKARIRGVQI